MKLRPVGMSAVDQLLRVARWRWTPFVGPVVGTSLFVLCLAWMVPDDFGTAGHHATRPSLGASLEAGTPSHTVSESTEAPSEHIATHTISEPSRESSHSQQQRRRGFSPPLERPEPPPSPSPMPPTVTPPPQPLGMPGGPGGPSGPSATETAQAAGMPAPTAEPVPPPVVQ